MTSLHAKYWNLKINYQKIHRSKILKAGKDRKVVLRVKVQGLVINYQQQKV